MVAWNFWPRRQMKQQFLENEKQERHVRNWEVLSPRWQTDISAKTFPTEAYVPSLCPHLGGVWWEDMPSPPSHARNSAVGNNCLFYGASCAEKEVDMHSGELKKLTCVPALKNSFSAWRLSPGDGRNKQSGPQSSRASLCDVVATSRVQLLKLSKKRKKSFSQS